LNKTGSGTKKISFKSLVYYTLFYVFCSQEEIDVSVIFTNPYRTVHCAVSSVLTSITYRSLRTLFFMFTALIVVHIYMGRRVLYSSS